MPNPFIPSDQNFHPFWKYKYGIENLRPLIDKLEKEGFIRVDKLSTYLEQESLLGLKDILSDFNLDTQGDKEVLINRITDKIDLERLDQRFHIRSYSLTEKGQRVIDKSDYIIYIHQYGFADLDIYSLSSLVYKNKDKSYKEIVWESLVKKSQAYKKEKDLGAYRNSRLEMAYFLSEEEDYLEAIEYLAELIYYDLSVLSNNLDDKFLDSYIKNVFRYNQSRLKIGPGIIDLMVDYQKNLGLDDQELRKLILSRIAGLRSELEIFTNEECVEIFFKERYNRLDELEEIYQNAESRYRNNN